MYKAKAHFRSGPGFLIFENAGSRSQFFHYFLTLSFIEYLGKVFIQRKKVLNLCLLMLYVRPIEDS